MAVRYDYRPMVGRASQTLISGVMGILPVALTLAVLAWVVVFLHDLVGPQSSFGKLLSSGGMSVTACEVTAYLVGLVGAILLVYLLGVLIENGVAMTWHSAMDNAMQRIPVVSTVYDASKNLTSVFDRRKDSLQGMAPVMCYFGPDSSIGTPALMPTSQRIRMDDQEYHIVIIPGAPVPFGGALLCVKADWVKPANCTFDELVGIYMSMGSSAPASLGEPPAPEATFTPAPVRIE